MGGIESHIQGPWAPQDLGHPTNSHSMDMVIIDDDHQNQ